MKRFAFSLWLIAMAMLIPIVAACERQGPPKPVGTATNKHVEESPARPPKEAAGALPKAGKTPLDGVRHAEETTHHPPP